ncbi:MAG: hypothetical protein Q4A66_10275, partial [Eubacteriales bacterium]|nr:hypothetical protein [Eubacteriales bacterium]
DLSINALYHSDAGDGITIVVDYAVYEREAGQPGHALSYFAVSAEGEPYDAQYLYGQPKTTDGWTSALQSCHLTFAKDEPLPETLLFAPFAGDQLLLEPDARMEAQREALALLSPQDCFSIRLKKPCTLLSPAQLP